MICTNMQESERAIALADSIDDVKLSLEGLSTISVALAESELADKPSLTVIANVLDAGNVQFLAHFDSGIASR